VSREEGDTEGEKEAEEGEEGEEEVPRRGWEQ
jgi:hypothetical protein